MSFDGRAIMLEGVAEAQAYRMDKVDDFLAAKLSFDKTDPIFQSFRAYTTLTMEVGSIAIGGYNVAAGGYRAFKAVTASERCTKLFSKISKLAKFNTKPIKSGNGFLGHKSFELKNVNYQKVRNKTTKIRGRVYGGHALDQMQNRGIPPSVIEETIQNGFEAANKVAGRIQFYDFKNNISVITEKSKVITVMYGRPTNGFN